MTDIQGAKRATISDDAKRRLIELMGDDERFKDLITFELLIDGAFRRYMEVYDAVVMMTERLSGIITSEVREMGPMSDLVRCSRNLRQRRDQLRKGMLLFPSELYEDIA